MDKALPIFLTFIFSSCQNQHKFDKQEWGKIGDLMTFPNRKHMIDDLVHNNKLKRRKYNYIIDLLGQPQSSFDSSGCIAYEIDIDYGVEDPVYSKTLIIQFSKDSIVSAYRINEWKK
jgi:hypothetical protein